MTEAQWFRELDESLQGVDRARTASGRPQPTGQARPPLPGQEPEHAAESHRTSHWWRQFEADAETP